MRITFVLVSLALMTGIFLASCNPTFALSVDQINNYLGYSIIHPAHPLYFLKTIREAVEIKIATTPRIKFIRKIEFATRRIREVKSLIYYKRQDFIEPTLERYGAILEEVSGVDLQEKEQVNMAQDEINNHLLILIKLYPQIEDEQVLSSGNKRAKISFRSTINKINRLNQKLTERLKQEKYFELAQKEVKLNRPACEFLAKESSSSALNEVEKMVLLERAGNCFNAAGI